MSALREDGVGNEEPIKVLFALHEGFHILDFTGPLSVLTAARHNPKDPSTEAFDVTIAAAKQNVLSGQDVVVQSHISWKEAKERIDEYVCSTRPISINGMIFLNGHPMKHD